jgi:hypothetical protein
MDLSPKQPRSKKASFIFTQNQPNAVILQVPIATFMQMVGLTGPSAKDYLRTYDLDAVIKVPVTEKALMMKSSAFFIPSILD